jgi:hypothetical protein
MKLQSILGGDEENLSEEISLKMRPKRKKKEVGKNLWKNYPSSKAS